MKNDKNIKTAFVYILVTIFCAVFGAVYEYFSHEVYSYFMLYAFIFPLVSAGAFLCMSLNLMKKSPGAGIRNLYHSGIATLTVGSIMRGVLDIYGTTNWLISIYWVVGTLLVVVSIICYLVQLKFLK
ncbi:MAG: hypothetical protein J6B39_07590 [Lachnospiraceae bacterium]|nr:hypothetical protein [Lachnospiraceae bacterium]